ncbi:centromere protein K isoform X2 [Dendropsophus ebraccatus]|uniref:centromere protein K isoform X2 n=1 Tax=Dendropsophus ebraccatus TaxID=150705 RepID=UPI003831DF00
MAEAAVSKINLDDLLEEMEQLARHMSLYQHDIPPNLLTPSMKGSEELIQRCEEIWAEIEKCQSKLMEMEPEVPPPNSDVEMFFLMMKAKALTAESEHWQETSPDIISNNQDILLAAGKEELQITDHNLELMLSTVRTENKQLKSDLEKEERWLEEQMEALEALKSKLVEVEKESETFSMKSVYLDIKGKIMKLKSYREELLSALGEFLGDHFPVPEEYAMSVKKKKGVQEPHVEWVRINTILEALINQLILTPNDPYIPIKKEYWPPYIEVLLRYGIALRHPEDPQRIRVEAFHQ